MISLCIKARFACFGLCIITLDKKIVIKVNKKNDPRGERFFVVWYKVVIILLVSVISKNSKAVTRKLLNFALLCV